MATFTITKTAGFFVDPLQNHHAIESLSFLADITGIDYDLGTLALSTQITFTTAVALTAPRQAEATAAVDGIGSHVLAYVAQNMTTLSRAPAVVSEGPDDIDIDVRPHHKVIGLAKTLGSTVNLNFYDFHDVLQDDDAVSLTLSITLSGGSTVNLNLQGNDVFLNNLLGTFKIDAPGTYDITVYRGQFSGRATVTRVAPAVSAP